MNVSGWGLAAIEPLLPLLPLALAAGLDLYLTLLLLGASALLGWATVTPEPLTDLGSPAVVAVSCLFYAVEVVTSRLPWAATVWNVLNALVRIVGAGTLVLLAARPSDPIVAGTAVLGASLLAGAVHVARTGWWFELDLRGAPGRTRILTIGAEDIVVAALLPLILHRPSARVILAVLVLAVGILGARRHLSAGTFAHRLVLTWLPAMMARGRWLDASSLPQWAHSTAGAAGPGDHAVRCTRVAAWGSAVPGTFRRGWLVVGLSGPVLVIRRGRRGVAVALTPSRVSGVRTDPLHARVDLDLGDGRHCGLAVPRGGPSPAALHQLFDRTEAPAGTP